MYQIIQLLFSISLNFYANISGGMFSIHTFTCLIAIMLNAFPTRHRKRPDKFIPFTLKAPGKKSSRYDKSDKYKYLIGNFSTSLILLQRLYTWSNFILTYKHTSTTLTVVFSTNSDIVSNKTVKDLWLEASAHFTYGHNFIVRRE